MPFHKDYPELHVWKSKYNDFITPVNQVIMLLCDSDAAAAQQKFKNYRVKHQNMGDSGDVVEALKKGPLDKYIYSYQTGSGGKPWNVITLPGLEYLCQTMCNIKSDDVKENFLQHIHTWKTLGKRSAQDPIDGQGPSKQLRIGYEEALNNECWSGVREQS